MDELTVNYDMLEDVTVVGLKNCATKVGNIREEMKATVNSLAQYMEAESAQMYIHEFEELVGPNIQAMEELITSYYQQLQDIANCFAERDRKLARKS